MPTVSIIVPSYNHASFLPECLASALSQTLEDWELHLVDDGSTDDSVEIALAHAEKDSRITVHVNESNLGTYGTQAKALTFCQGDFVAVLNSDDFWHATKLEKQVELLRAEASLPLCYVLGWKVDEQGQIDKSDNVHADWPTATVQDVFPQLVSKNRILASGVLFRRKLLKFEPSLRYSGDWVALLRLAFCGSVGCFNERLTYWRMHGHNSFVASKNQVLEEIRVRKAILSKASTLLQSGHDRDAVKRGLDECRTSLIALHVLIGDGAGARSLAISALADPKSSQTLRRRALSTFLPLEKTRKHLWGETVSGLDDLLDPSIRQTLAQLPPLDLDIG